MLLYSLCPPDRRNREAAGAKDGNADSAASGHDADDIDVVRR